MKKVLLGVTGSVATVLVYKLVAQLEQQGFEVQVVATEASRYFFSSEKLSVPLCLDQHEWPEKPYEKDDPIRHIELRDWADVLLIAPLTANTLAKMANGLCDNLLTSVIRAWNLDKSIIIAPAMNTKMWEHPLTSQQLALVSQWSRLTVIQPASKKLACGDDGIGAMANLDEIVSAAAKFIQKE